MMLQLRLHAGRQRYRADLFIHPNAQDNPSQCVLQGGFMSIVVGLIVVECPDHASSTVANGSEARKTSHQNWPQLASSNFLDIYDVIEDLMSLKECRWCSILEGSQCQPKHCFIKAHTSSMLHCCAKRQAC